MGVCISVCAGTDFLCIDPWRDTGPPHWHSWNADRDIAIKVWVIERADVAGETDLGVRNSRLSVFWHSEKNLPLQFAGQRRPSALLFRQSPLCEALASFPISIRHHSLLPPWYVMVMETMRQYINTRRIFCPNLNKNWLNLSPVCVSLKLSYIENSKCLAMSEFNHYLLGMKLCINAQFSGKVSFWMVC